MTDAFAIFNILTMLGVNTSGQEGKNKLSSLPDGQYPIIFEGYLTVRPHYTFMESEGAFWFWAVVLFLCFLPAAAVLLAIIAGLLAFFPVRRIFSLVLAILCLVIYTAFWLLLIPSQFGQQVGFRGQLNSLPAGRFFHSLIPLALAIVVVGFDIYALIKRKRKDDHVA